MCISQKQRHSPTEPQFSHPIRKPALIQHYHPNQEPQPNSNNLNNVTFFFLVQNPIQDHTLYLVSFNMKVLYSLSLPLGSSTNLIRAQPFIYS